MSRTYHQVLGVAITATQDEIRDAYRRLARLHHPDRGGDPSEFQRVTRAYKGLKLCEQCQGAGFVLEGRGVAKKKVPCAQCSA